MKLKKDLTNKSTGIKAVFPLLCRSYFILICNAGLLISQNTFNSPYRLGGGIGTHISGNAHGGIYDISGSLYNGKRLFSLGACVQKRTGTLCGARLNYKYMVTGRDNFSKGRVVYAENDEKLQLYFFSSLQYIHQAGLSFGAVKTEESLAREHEASAINFSKLKLSTVEVCGGFGLSLKITDKLVWDNCIGLSTYYQLNYANGMYEDRMAPVLMMGTSLRLNYFK